MSRVYAPLAAVWLALLPACARRAEPPAVVIAPEPAEPAVVYEGTAPPPREVPLAAEPSDAKDAMEVFLVAKEGGALTVQYPQGQRVVLSSAPEHGPLVLPLNKPVKFICTAEKDATTIEIPAFPFAVEAQSGRYTSSAAVKPTRAGEFGVWSGQNRVGRVVVVPAAEFEDWLAGVGPLHGKHSVDGSPMHQGRQLFLKLQCIRCHSATQEAKAPVLEGLYGTKVTLKGGGAEIADEQYIRESIRKPKAKVVEGWEPIMPEYGADKVSDEELNALVAYIRSLKNAATPDRAETFPPPVGAPTERTDPPKNRDPNQPRRDPLPVAPPPRAK